MQYTTTQVIILPHSRKIRACCIVSVATETIVLKRNSVCRHIKIRHFRKHRTMRSTCGPEIGAMPKSGLGEEAGMKPLTNDPIGMPNANSGPRPIRMTGAAPTFRVCLAERNLESSGEQSVTLTDECRSR